MVARRTAVLLLAYGSPDRLEEVADYYTDIRGGRRPAPELLDKLTQRYARVGVPTPLRAVSERLARRVEDRLNASADDERFSVHLGMKHWTPRIAAAVEDAVRTGADRLVAIVLAPHYSKISIGGYRAQVEKALAASTARPELTFIESWHDLDGYLNAVAENVSAVRRQFSEPAGGTVVFTAHSLPARILNEGDPYLDQLLETSEAVAARAAVDRWRFSFQSQSHTGEPWLGPDLLDTLERLKENAQHQVLVAPLGFIADHLEIFYDIDIEAQDRARTLGLELRRTPMLNDDERLADALAGLVISRIRAQVTSS